MKTHSPSTFCREPFRRIFAWLLVSVLGFAVSAQLGAQSVSPASIFIPESQACSGGTDAAGEVCVTLPDDATCNTADIFLLFDDTGSFSDYPDTTGDIFQNLVDDLRSRFPNVNFAFGVGRFEDYGGPGTGFGGAIGDTPFVLNQAVLSVEHSDFDSDLLAALSNMGTRGGGGDDAESAIEALFQVATGFGFNGNPDDGPGLGEFSEGDVPAFSSYVGSKSGTLGGVGWRPNSCLRLLLLATDICTVAPHPQDEPIPTSFDGAGATLDASAFRCTPDPNDQRNRFGPVDISQSPSTSGTIAPVGAATVQETIDVLNDLGIRVAGLVAPHGLHPTPLGPTFSTTPSFDPSIFLSALARLTGAVDAAGDPLVFGITDNPTVLQNRISEAVETSLTTPIDVTLEPDPELDGLTVHVDPPVQVNVRPGEEACFLVDFEGDETFPGGSLGLGFKDPATGGSLGMTVPATLRCPDCFDLVTTELLCDVEADGTVSYEWQFILRNRTFDDIHHVFFVDLPPNVSIEILDTVPGLPSQPGQPQKITAKITGASPGQVLDFRITMHDQTLATCCDEDITLELPECDCAQLPGDFEPRCFSFPLGSGVGPPWRYGFELENLTTEQVQYLLLAPVSTSDLMTPLPPGELILDPQVVFLPSAIGLGGTTGGQTVEIRGPAARPGNEVCFRISTHDASFDNCCSIVKCLKIPDCTFGSVHLESIGSAELLYSGPSLIVTGLGESGDSGLDDGVSGSFASANGVAVDLQDFSLGFDLPEGTAVRFGGGTLDDGGTREETANVVATLTESGVIIAPDASAPDVVEVQILRDGELVTSLYGAAELVALDGDWPTFIIVEDVLAGANAEVLILTSPLAAGDDEKDLITSNNIAGVAWAEPVALSLANGGAVMGDQAIFRFQPSSEMSRFDYGELKGRGMDAIVLKSFLPEPPPFLP